MQKASVTALTISELLRENQQEVKLGLYEDSFFPNFSHFSCVSDAGKSPENI